MLRKLAVTVSEAVVFGVLTLSAASGPTIGMVSSDPGQAGVLIDGARVSSNASLFEGSQVLSSGYSRLVLNSGVRVDLGADSSMRVFSNYASLEKGAGEVRGALGYAIDARSLRIQLADAGSAARVRLDGSQGVVVAALSGLVNVWNNQGILVARVLPDTPMSFIPQAASASLFRNSGCVVNKSNAAVLVDETGNQVFELRSSVKSADLSKFLGKRASIAGTLNASATPVSGANQVVNVSTIILAAGGECATVAARIGAGMGEPGSVAPPGATAGAGAASGMTPAVVGGVIAVVAAAAVVGGLAAAGAFSTASP